MKTGFAPFCFAMVILISCNPSIDTISPLSNSVVEIRWGSSFGMCVGYCIEENRISGTTLTQTHSSWNNTESNISCVNELSINQVDSLSQFIDKQAFISLPEIIGCPDCADGGAAWVEILFTDESSHKVTFEYFHEPESIKELVEVLRFRSNFLKQHCYEQAQELKN